MVADDAHQVAHQAGDIFGVLVEKKPAALGWKNAEEPANEVHEAAGLFELIAKPAQEPRLGDALVDQVGILFHHPVDVDFKAPAMEIVGQAHVANDGAFVRPGGEGEKRKDGLGHRRGD